MEFSALQVLSERRCTLSPSGSSLGWTAAAQEQNSLAAAAQAGQCWMKDCGAVPASWLRMSCTPRQQLLDRNHAVTEADFSWPNH